MKLILLLIIIFPITAISAQEINKPFNLEENLIELNEAQLAQYTKYDEYVALLNQYKNHPININVVEEDELSSLVLLNPLQIQALIEYRLLLGCIIDMYELQAIPFWDIQTISNLRAYITVLPSSTLDIVVKDILKNAKNNLSIRTSQVYGNNKKNDIGDYLGSPQYFSIKYGVKKNNVLQYGFLAEKDAGESFFKGAQKNGFDFYSAHCFIKNLGKIKSIALGDFSLNIGQGLIQWQSIAFNKGADILSIKRQGQVLKPYISIGETDFQRGVGVSVGIRSADLTVFFSDKKNDATINNESADSISIGTATSIIEAGLHRTFAEIAKKNNNKLTGYGFCLSIKNRNGKIGFNFLSQHFKIPIQKMPSVFNLNSFHGYKLENRSIDYSYSLKGVHLFGEWAMSNNEAKAFVGGALKSFSKNISMSMLYRNISPAYWSYHSNAFIENSSIENERGLYWGIIINPKEWIQINAYADHFKFPFLKYGVNGLCNGYDYFLQFTYLKGKKMQIYSSIKTKTTLQKESLFESVVATASYQTKQIWKNEINIVLSENCSMKNKFEFLQLNFENATHKEGYLLSFSFKYKSKLMPVSFVSQYSCYETTDYSSRIYSSEFDAMGGELICYYDKGFRFSINGSLAVSKKIKVFLKWACNYKYANSSINAVLQNSSKYNSVINEAKMSVVFSF